MKSSDNQYTVWLVDVVDGKCFSNRRLRLAQTPASQHPVDGIVIDNRQYPVRLFTTQKNTRSRVPGRES